MKVYIVTNEPFPNGMAATNRIICYSKALLMAGIDIEVLCYFRTELSGIKITNSEAEGVYNNIPYRYIGGTPIRSGNPVIRRINYWKDKTNTICYLKLNMHKGDVIFCYLREDPYAIRLQNFAHKHGYKIVRELCEYPYATRQLNAETKLKSDRYLTSTFQRFDGTICISHSLLDIAKKFSPQGKHIKIPILIDEANWNAKNIEPKKFDYPYLFHSGELFQQKDGIIDVLNSFADAIPYLPKGTKYFFTGKLENSRDKKQIEATILQRNLENSIEFLGFLPREELMRFMKGATAFIIYKNENLQNKYCFATKLGEYLLTGNPVITTMVGEANFYLQNNESAYIVTPGDRKQLTNTIIHCLENTQEAQMVGNQGRQIAINQFYLKSQSGKLKAYFESL